MNARISDLLNRIELVAHKMGMAIEEVVDILEGKHPAYCVMQTHAKLPEPVPATPPAPPTPAAPSAVPSPEPAPENPIGSGPAAVSAVASQPGVDSTVESSVQNQLAANSNLREGEQSPE